MSEQMLACSPITDNIYLGRYREDKNGNMVCTGKKDDMTESALESVVTRTWQLMKHGRADRVKIEGRWYELTLKEVKE